MQYRIYPWKTDGRTLYHIVTEVDGRLVSPEYAYSKDEAEHRIICMTWNDALMANPLWQNGRIYRRDFVAVVAQLTGVEVDVPYNVNIDESITYRVEIVSGVWIHYNCYNSNVEFAYFS